MARQATGAPPRRIGRYALHSEIASGGMATVHFGRLLGPVGFSRTVAIKRLHPAYATDPEFVSMFLDEARLAARIRHPNVVPTLDVVATEGELFLVMDYVQGESLARLWRDLREHGERIPPRIVVAIMSGCLQGLHAAHEATDERGMGLDIVHRDVSPQNIIVGVDGLARVLDFGVAKAAGRLQTTREGQLKGKLAYMPPEQLHNDSVTRQVDIYAGAVVLWEALTMERPFKAETEAMVLARVLEGKIKPPSEVAPGLPKGFDDVTARGLSRQVSNRYKTAREMAQAIEKCVPAASMAEVAEWLESVAGPALRERARKVAQIEQSDGGSIPDVAAVVAELRPALPKSAAAREESSKRSKIDSTRLGLGPEAATIPEAIRLLPPEQAAQVAKEATTIPQAVRLIGPEPESPDTREPGPPSQVSSVSVSSDRLTLPRGLRKRRPVALVLGAGLGVLAFVAIVVGLAIGRRESTSPAVGASQPSAPPPVASSIPAVVAAPEPPREPASPPPTAASAAVDAGGPVVRPPVPVGGRTPPPKKPGGGSAFDRLGGRD